MITWWTYTRAIFGWRTSLVLIKWISTYRYIYLVNGSIWELGTRQISFMMSAIWNQTHLLLWSVYFWVNKGCSLSNFVFIAIFEKVYLLHRWKQISSKDENNLDNSVWWWQVLKHKALGRGKSLCCQPKWFTLYCGFNIW